MLHPSYTDLMKVVNKDVEEGETKVVNSRYSIVMATAKRAREIIDGSMPLVDTKPGEKPLSIAISEMNQGKITVVGEEEAARLAEMEAEQAEAEQEAEASDDSAQENEETEVSEEAES